MTNVVEQFTIPDGFADILKSFTREVLRDQQEDINEARACLFYTQLSKRDTFAEYRWRFGYFNGYSHEMPQKEWTYRIVYDPISQTKEEDQNET